jgi:hypothetical protein
LHRDYRWDLNTGDLFWIDGDDRLLKFNYTGDNKGEIADAVPRCWHLSLVLKSDWLIEQPIRFQYRFLFFYMERHGVFWVDLGVFEVEESDFVINCSKFVLFYPLFALISQHLGTCSALDGIFGCWVPALTPLECSISNHHHSRPQGSMSGAWIVYQSTQNWILI